MTVRGQGVQTDASNTVPGTAHSRVLIVDDHRMLADAFERALTARGFSCEVADVASASVILDQAARMSPDLVLLDLDLGGVDGLELVGELRARGLRVLVVTSCEDHGRLAAAVALGSLGWVAKARPFEEMLDAAASACRDRPLLPPRVREELINAGREYVDLEGDVGSRIAALTPREREVLEAIIRGESAQEMADDFVVSLGTVRNHIQSVLAKLGVSSQLSAAAIAVRWAVAKRGLDRENLLAP
jgi:DNA-binding NarL/FixJ family response regulator